MIYYHIFYPFVSSQVSIYNLNQPGEPYVFTSGGFIGLRVILISCVIITTLFGRRPPLMITSYQNLTMHDYAFHISAYVPLYE